MFKKFRELGSIRQTHRWFHSSRMLIVAAVAAQIQPVRKGKMPQHPCPKNNYVLKQPDKKS
ncbi:MAG: hypothetical protein LC646_08595 [Xanthomonadaceae bacterium]|nr:hypothetical protein [Xanthomonadaceae bacterium]